MPATGRAVRDGPASRAAIRKARSRAPRRVTRTPANKVLRFDHRDVPPSRQAVAPDPTARELLAQAHAPPRGTRAVLGGRLGKEPGCPRGADAVRAAQVEHAPVSSGGGDGGDLSPMTLAQQAVTGSRSIARFRTETGQKKSRLNVGGQVGGARSLSECSLLRHYKVQTAGWAHAPGWLLRSNGAGLPRLGLLPLRAGALSEDGCPQSTAD